MALENADLGVEHRQANAGGKTVGLDHKRRLASADPRVVAINLVGEEDEHTSMTDYADHMRIVGFLRTLYPKVRVSLHAGELAPGLVPPEGVGLRNTRGRLQQLYNEDHALVLEDAPGGGCTVKIRVPYRNTNEEVINVNVNTSVA